MIIDGKNIAADIYREVAEELQGRGSFPRLLVITAAPNLETQKYLRLKQAKAAALGIEVAVKEFGREVTTAEIDSFLRASFFEFDGVILQLPLPSGVDTDSLLALLPTTLDTDAMNYRGGSAEVLPPVVGAVKEIAERHGVDFAGKTTVVIGKGKLVGVPAALWAQTASANVTVVDKTTDNIDEVLRSADIIISGAGSPGLITSEKIKDGVVIFDAGTSEEGGVLRGDADPAVAEKAAIFTPVPGGIGPITIAVLLRNLIILSR